MPRATTKIDLEKILTGGQLPALPQSAINLLQLSKDAKVGPGEFAVPIETDPGLTSQVLKFVNSSYFGFSREISSVKLAITLVGMRTIKNFALWSAVFSLMPNPKCGPFDLKCLWQDSLRRAIFARAIARLLNLKETEEPFAAALLQDMAVPLLAKQFPEQYAELLVRRDGGHKRLSDLEHERFGYTHAQVAGQMARHWNLPESNAVLIEQHTEIEQVISQVAARPAEAAVALSAMLPAMRDENWPEVVEFEGYYQRALPRGPALGEVLGKTDVEFTDFAPVLKIPSPAKTLVQCYAESLAAASA
jgi:HD-like signal output (HDOD) protein